MTETIRNTILNQAMEVYEENGGWEEMVGSLAERIGEDEELTTEALKYAAEEYLTQVQCKIRSKMARQPQKPITYSKEEKESVVTSCSRFLGMLDWPMMNHTRLRDADKVLLLSDATRYQGNANGNAINAEFLRNVAKKLKEGQKVVEVWKEEQLRKEMEKAKKIVSSD